MTASFSAHHAAGVRLPSNRVQVAIVFGVGVLLAFLDWLEYRHFDIAIAVAAGAVFGLTIRLVRRAAASRQTRS